MKKLIRPLTDDEFIRFRNNVKCNWLKCSGGMGLAGRGCCSFGGEWNNPNCGKFITDADWEKQQKKRLKGEK